MASGDIITDDSTLFRSLHSQDAPAIRDLHATVPAVPTVFGSTPSDLRNLMALAAAVEAGDLRYRVIGAFDQGRLTGIASFVAAPASTTAEVTLILARGTEREVGTTLLRRLTCSARERGVQRFLADVAPPNSAMMRLFIAAGFATVTHQRNDIARAAIHL